MAGDAKDRSPRPGAPRAAEEGEVLGEDNEDEDEDSEDEDEEEDEDEDSEDEDEEDGAWPRGLVAVGGKLDADTLTRAYRSGVFPWSSDPQITWWCPDPRAVFELETFHVPRSLRKSIRRHDWRFAIDRDFEGVMRACAERTADRPSTWISEDFVLGYVELHRRGHAHSVEVYEGDELVGGLYGVTFGSFFGGESMFHRRTDASKAAVSHLVEHLRARGFTLLDAQVSNPHLLSLGAIEIPRRVYLERLRRALSTPATF